MPTRVNGRPVIETILHEIEKRSLGWLDVDAPVAQAVCHGAHDLQDASYIPLVASGVLQGAAELNQEVMMRYDSAFDLIGDAVLVVLCKNLDRIAIRQLPVTVVGRRKPGWATTGEPERDSECGAQGGQPWYVVASGGCWVDLALIRGGHCEFSEPSPRRHPSGGRAGHSRLMVSRVHDGAKFERPHDQHDSRHDRERGDEGHDRRERYRW